MWDTKKIRTNGIQAKSGNPLTLEKWIKEHTVSVENYDSSLSDLDAIVTGEFTDVSQPNLVDLYKELISKNGGHYE